ncbi:hypothetical protein AZL_a05110 (plasmid) [Azospirillum sp. B510]|uniref:type IVB secretion system protein IcmH/DotU n=1 Tax=Azospirillum sp. (strain B510) TaxID=137722 RepID=UPI0001C4BCAE|nr:type IVB secretion system protein IcmH/DotU [Azospirillum sp. B510]BAI74042.1 hypothetical protein AZL_a05110 [Azospirillum sp. B510]
MSQFIDEDDAPTTPRPIQVPPPPRPAVPGRPQPPTPASPRIAAPQRPAAPQALLQRRPPAADPTAMPARGRDGGTNALLTAAGPLLTMVTQVAFSSEHADADALQRGFLAAFTRFETEAAAAGYREDTVTTAKYVLAALVDEMVLDTGWGFESVWGSRSLLSLLFRETWGGEKVFTILDRLKAEPDRNIDALELIGRCLAFGFQGKYRRLDGGLYQLEDLRSELDRLCRSLRPAVDPRLASTVAPVKAATRLRRFLPGWVVFVLVAVLLAGAFLSAKGKLNQRAEAALASLARVAGAGTAAGAAAVPARAPAFLPAAPNPSPLTAR